jgi:hypothetical protein
MVPDHPFNEMEPNSGAAVMELATSAAENTPGGNKSEYSASISS